MNPYTENVLDTTLRKMSEQQDIARKQLGSSAISSGAFGDARHGIAEAMNTERYRQDMADTVSQGMADAYNNAMGLRTSDLSRISGERQFNAGQKDTAANRLLQAREFNANQRDAAADRKLSAGTTLANIAGQTQAQKLAAANALAQSGQAQQQLDQNAQDFAYAEFLRSQGYSDQQINSLVSAIQALPYNKTTYTTSTGTTSQPDNWAGSLLGATLGAIF